jgi:ABC-type nickel/cobalt efflux system permease component RcnA
VWSASVVGAAWGLGHTVALVAVAVVVIGLHAEIPASVGPLLELGVAAMLVGLGANLLWTLRRGGRLHVHRHAHGGHRHVHLHVHEADAAPDEHHHPVRAVRRPFLVGLVHGLAGSAGLMLAVLATIPSRALALAYVAVFAAGSVGGMVVVSAVVGMPLALAAERFARAEAVLRTCAGLGSVAVGVRIAAQVVVARATGS